MISQGSSAATRIALTEDPVRLASIGCGGMGRRHLAGLAELPRASYLTCGLLAVCDPNERNAGDLADEAHELLGEHPAAEPLSCAIHGVERGGLRPVDSVASIGAGALGLPVLSVA